MFQLRQLWDAFFTPGLLASMLGGKPVKSVDASLALRKAPAVTLERMGPADARAVNGKARLKVCARAEGGEVGDIFLLHNGRALAAAARGIARVSKSTCKEIDVLLTPGSNTFIGAAYDASHAVFGESRAVYVRYEEAALARPDMYILAVGISEYADRNIRLLYPSDDAIAVSSTLKQTADSLYGTVHVRTLTDRQGTRRNIQKALSDIASAAEADDTVILYFAGHGDTELGDYYFLGYDADITDLAGTAVAVKDLSLFARNATANKIALFLDTCKSGAAARQIGEIAMARGLEERKILASLAKERGIAVFSASAPDQSAFEIKSLAHGIFTYCLIDYLQNKPDEVASNKAISVAKLLGSVSRAVRTLAKERLKLEQTPILYVFGDDFSLGLIE